MQYAREASATVFGLNPQISMLSNGLVWPRPDSAKNQLPQHCPNSLLARISAFREGGVRLKLEGKVAGEGMAMTATPWMAAWHLHDAGGCSHDTNTKGHASYVYPVT